MSLYKLCQGISETEAVSVTELSIDSGKFRSGRAYSFPNLQEDKANIDKAKTIQGAAFLICGMRGKREI